MQCYKSSELNCNSCENATNSLAIAFTSENHTDDICHYQESFLCPHIQCCTPCEAELTDYYQCLIKGWPTSNATSLTRSTCDTKCSLNNDTDVTDDKNGSTSGNGTKNGGTDSGNGGSNNTTPINESTSKSNATNTETGINNTIKVGNTTEDTSDAPFYITFAYQSINLLLLFLLGFTVTM